MITKTFKEKVYYLYNQVSEITLAIYLLLVLVAFPGYIWDKYWEMSYRKWTFYIGITIPFLIAIFVWNFFRIFIRVKRKYCLADLLIMTYGLISTMSFMKCDSPRAAFMGTDGWYMGYVAQMFFVLTYFAFRFFRVRDFIVIASGLIGSVYCFLIAIFQRHGNDFLHLYYNLPDEVVRDYLSTIGNRTWFSAYVCAICPLGIYMFWRSKTVLQQIVFGIYTYLAFACIAVTNSDSAYVGILAVFYVLGLLSLKNAKSLKKFFETLAIWAGACLSMGLLRIPYAYIVRELRGLSKLFLRIDFSAGLLIISILFLCLAWMLGRKDNWIDVVRVRKWILIITGLCMLIVILLIVFNTTGLLQRLFGITIQNPYLLFDEHWGDYRGSSWMLTIKMLSKLPLGKQLIGVGPDCFAHYAYSKTEYSQYLYNFWGNTILANAHNEWLNQFLCVGILGGLAYLGSFLYIMLQCLRCEDEEKPVVPAVGLCIVGYMAHNFFCYQQVSATGVIFVLMGIAMSKLKETKEYGEIQFFQDKNKKWRQTK